MISIVDILLIYFIDAFRIPTLLVKSRDNGFGHMLRKTSKGLTAMKLSEPSLYLYYYFFFFFLSLLKRAIEDELAKNKFIFDIITAGEERKTSKKWRKRNKLVIEFSSNASDTLSNHPHLRLSLRELLKID